MLTYCSELLFLGGDVKGEVLALKGCADTDTLVADNGDVDILLTSGGDVDFLLPYNGDVDILLTGGGTGGDEGWVMVFSADSGDLP